AFNGKVDGQGHKIKNLKIDFYAYQSGAGRLDADNKYVALFGYTGPDFVLKRLVMDDSCRICGGEYTASFVGYFNGRIEECYSACVLVSVQKTAVTASSYEEGAFLTWSSEGVYVPCVGAYSSTASYFVASNNVGGFVGDLVAAGCAIVRSYFCGTLPDVNDAYGFVGVGGTALSLVTDDSWYLTTNTEYPYESSYGRVLIDYADGTNGGTLTVSNDWDGRGFYVSLSANEKYYPFIYNNNFDALSLSAAYRLASNTQVKYQIRYCQEVVFTVENGVVGTETVMTAQGNKAPIGGKYYYYKGQEGSVTFTWRTHGYYLADSVTVNGVTSAFGSDIINGTEEEIVYSFVMDETSDTFVIKVTALEIGSAVFDFTGSFSFDYNGETHSVGSSVGNGFAANIVYINAESSVRTDMLNAGNYYAVASLRYAGGSVVIGKKEISCSVAPITLTVASGADLGYFGEKVYDGNATSRVAFTDPSVFVGLLDGDEDTLAVSALVTWDSATSGENKTYSLSDFIVTLTTNYVFASGYELAGLTGGTISRRRVVVSVSGSVATTLGQREYEVTTVVYSGKSPVAPEGAYVVNVSWNYQKMIVSGAADPVADPSWSGKYDIGYYLMTPSLADETNHYLDAEGKTYYLCIVPYTVTSLTFVYNSLTYTGSPLTSSVTAYFAGVGEDGSRQNVSIDYYVRRPDVTENTFTSGLFVRNEAETGFVEATSYSASAAYYALATLRKAGSYYAVCRSLRDNYVVAAPIREIVVAKAVPSQSIGFVLSCGGVEIENGGSVYYTDDIVVTFTDALSLKTADAEYDATYALSFDARPNGGDLICRQINGVWHILPQEYGANMVFRLTSLSASDYENRVSDVAFTLTVLPVKLYVGITHPEQVFGDVLDFSLTYYKNAQHTETIAAEEIDGLYAPVVSTGAFTADKVGEYQLFYGGGSSYGYEFDRSAVPTLTIVPRRAYVSVPAEVSNTKIYGDTDPTIRYYVYADAACSERLTVLPDGRTIELNGKLSRQEGENVGSYNIYEGTLVSSALNPDYSLTFVSGNGKFVINYLDIRLQVKEGQSKYYGDEDQPFLLEVAEGYSLVNGDLISSFLFGENPIVTISREEGETVGGYAYIVTVDYSMAALGNYNILSVETPGYYYINRVRPTISFTFDGVVYYGDTTDQMSYASARAYNDTTVIPGAFSWSQKSFETLNVTTATLNFTPNDTRNYASNSLVVVVIPQKRPVYPIFSGETEYVYDGVAHNNLTVTLDNTVSGGTYSVRTNVSGDNRTVTTEGFVVTAELTSDYYVFPADANVGVHCKIVPAVVTVRAKSAVIKVGDAFLPEIEYEGFIRSESESVLTTRATVGVVNGNTVSDKIPVESGVYTLMPKGAVAKNYTFVYAGGVLTINKLSAESDGISVAGNFSPEVEVTLTEVQNDTYAFEDLQSGLDKKLGATIFKPLSHCLSAYYDIRLSGALEDDAEYVYTVSLSEELPTGAKVYVRGKDGALTELEDYTTEG
ncbi:MAG: hypothetical protein J5781_06155, partial [Clostridia bacterium]|nr:hypothetical protein [Clostridia bacterium]